MTTVKPDQMIRTTVDVLSHFGERIIPAGTPGLVLEVNPGGTCLVEVTLRPATDTDDGDFDQATLADGQFEVLR